jgi:hypothetical protein
MPARARRWQWWAAQAPDPTWAALRAVLSERGDGRAVPVDALVDAAARGHVLALLADRRPDLAPRLARDLAAESFVQLHITRAQSEIAAVLTAAGLARAPALLKGNATAHLVYDSPALRATLDVDLLVAAADFDAALAALHAAGWLDAAPAAFRAVNRDDAYEHPLARDIGRVRVGCDLHRRLARGHRFRIDHDGILARAITAPNVPLPLCHPEDALLHTALHAATSHFAVPLKAWVDLDRLCRHPDVDLGTVAARARDQRMATALWAGLRVVERWFFADLDPRLMADLRPDAARARALDWLLAGEGATPLRQPSTLRQAQLLAGPLIADGAAARSAWVVETLQLATRARWARHGKSIGPD